MFNQNQSIWDLVIFEQNTKAIALLFGQKSLIVITLQSAMKVNEVEVRSVLGHNDCIGVGTVEVVKWKEWNMYEKQCQ